VLLRVVGQEARAFRQTFIAQPGPPGAPVLRVLGWGAMKQNEGTDSPQQG